MLIGPAATSYLISKTIKQMFLYSMLFGALAAIIGYYLAKLWDTSIAGMMAAAVGMLFMIVLIGQKLIERKRKAHMHKLKIT